MHIVNRLSILGFVTSSKPRERAATPTNAREGSTTERRAALVAIAAEMFAERGYKATTVRQIGDAAGVLSGSLYHHFESKESIADELLSSYLDQLLDSYRVIVADDEPPREKLGRLVAAAFKSLETHRAAIVVLQNERHELGKLPRFSYLKDREAEIRDVWLQVIEDGVKEGQIRTDIDPAIIYRFARDAIWVAVRWFQPGGTLSVDDITEQYLAIMLEGIAVGPRRRKRPATPKRA